MTEELLDLGWANKWAVWPELITKCFAANHHRTDIDVGPPNRGIEHVVKCLDGCGYVYRYDSSD